MPRTKMKMSGEWWDGLSEKERRYCDAYSANGGNKVAAARAAGYKQPRNQALQIFKRPRVIRALEKLRSATTNAAILTREQRQKFWSETILDQNLDYKDRLRASELLGKSQADFVDRTQLEGKNGDPLVISLYLPDNKRS